MTTKSRSIVRRTVPRAHAADLRRTASASDIVSFQRLKYAIQQSAEDDITGSIYSVLIISYIWYDHLIQVC